MSPLNSAGLMLRARRSFKNCKPWRQWDRARHYLVNFKDIGIDHFGVIVLFE
jgi:hypothetical protein